MSALETVVEELKTLPPKKFAAVADYVHRLTETSLAERRRALDRANGNLTEAEADALTAAVRDNHKLKKSVGNDHSKKKNCSKLHPDIRHITGLVPAHY